MRAQAEACAKRDGRRLYLDHDAQAVDLEVETIAAKLLVEHQQALETAVQVEAKKHMVALGGQALAHAQRHIEVKIETDALAKHLVGVAERAEPARCQHRFQAVQAQGELQDRVRLAQLKPRAQVSDLEAAVVRRTEQQIGRVGHLPVEADGDGLVGPRGHIRLCHIQGTDRSIPIALPASAKSTDDARRYLHVPIVPWLIFPPWLLRVPPLHQAHGQPGLKILPASAVPVRSKSEGQGHIRFQIRPKLESIGRFRR